MAKRKFKRYTRKQILNIIKINGWPDYYNMDWIKKHFPFKGLISFKDVLKVRSKYFSYNCWGRREEKAYENKVEALCAIAPDDFATEWGIWYGHYNNDYNRSEIQKLRIAVERYEKGVDLDKLFY